MLIKYSRNLRIYPKKFMTPYRSISEKVRFDPLQENTPNNVFQKAETNSKNIKNQIKSYDFPDFRTFIQKAKVRLTNNNIIFTISSCS